MSAQASSSHQSGVLNRNSTGPVRGAEMFVREGYVTVVVDIAERDLDRLEVDVDGDILWLNVEDEAGSVKGRLSFPVPPNADLNRIEVNHKEQNLIIVVPTMQPSQSSDEAYRTSRFDLSDELFERLAQADGPDQIVRLLGLSADEIRSFGESQALDDDELEAVGQLSRAVERPMIEIRLSDVAEAMPDAVAEWD